LQILLHVTRQGISFNMSGRPFVVSQQKLAEKLTILKDRGVGMLTRIYNIKKGREFICLIYF
jgi:hypothetical protein